VAAVATGEKAREAPSGPRVGKGLCAVAAAVALLSAAVYTAWSRRGEGPDALFRRARAELVAGHPDRAEAAVRDLARLQRPTPFDRLLRAQIASAGHRPDDAMAELADVADGHPLAPVARILAGQTEAKRFRFRAAEAQFLAAVALSPKAVQAHRELSFLYNIQQRQDDLDRELFTLSELNDLTFDYLVHWGKTHNVAWKPDRDCETLARVVAADPADRRCRLALADGLRRLSRTDDAAETLAPLPESDPDARARRVLLAFDRGDHAAIDRLLAEGPTGHALLDRLRGQVALLRGDPSGAVVHFRRAYQADPFDRTTLQGLAQSLKLSGDGASAETFSAAARRHDAITALISTASSRAGREDPQMAARLGAACEAAGRLYEARAWYRLALGRDPLDRECQTAMSRLGRAIEERASAGRVAAAAPAGS